MSLLIIDIMVAAPIRVGVVDDEDTSTGPGHAIAVDVPRQVVGLDGTPQRQDRVLQFREPSAWRELSILPCQRGRHEEAVDQPVDLHTDPETGQSPFDIRERELHQPVIPAQQTLARIV